MPHAPPIPNDTGFEEGGNDIKEAADTLRTNISSACLGRTSDRDTNHHIRHDGGKEESFLDVDASPDRTEVGVFHNAVVAARQSIEQSFAGSEKVGEAVSLRLTLDLSSQNLKTLPDEVVDIIRDDVERLKLSHNQILHVPLRFQECTLLKYLNLRDNRFREFPQAVLSLSQLEIFDISRNKLTRIPDDVRNMKALRVLSVSNNNIESVSPQVAMMDNIKILKLDGNPLHSELKRIVDESANSPSQINTADNKKDFDTTERVKNYLVTAEGAGNNWDGDSSDGPLDTPRAPKRNLSYRFPVKPSTSGSESVSDTGNRSPGFAKPPIPKRSHYRNPSGQNELLHGSALRRPGLAPLSNGNERNRSNSEGVLQITQTNRSKRMGMVTKKQKLNGLERLDEIHLNRNSLHLRGQSHGSALHDKGNFGIHNGEDAFSGPGNRNAREGTFVHRLSSLPESNRDSALTNSTVEGAKSLLYSLHQLNQQISTLIPLMQNRKTKKSNFDQVYYCAAKQLESLDQALHGFQEPGTAEERSNDAIGSTCDAAIVAYRQIGSYMIQKAARLASGGDQRYIRTMMILLYGSLTEVRNGCWNLAPLVMKETYADAGANQLPTNLQLPCRPDRSVTPTRDRPNPERRWRNGPTSIQTLHYTPASSGAQTAVPLFVNGRSRSNSRAGGLINSSTNSIANTPRSGESFKVLGTPQLRSRSNSALGQYSHTLHHTLDSSAHNAYFEKIFDLLTSAVQSGYGKLPFVINHSKQCLNVAQTSEKNRPFVKLWEELNRRTEHCLQMSKTMQQRLVTIKLNEPDVRYSKDFWFLCTRLFEAATKMFDIIKEAKRLELIARDMVVHLQPLLKAIREASHLVYTSPWAHLVEAETPPERATTALDIRPTNGMHPHDYYQQQQNFRYRSRTESGNSPYQTNIPATPLSAALGPAVQATVPTGTSLDRSFAGDVFQRAEEFLRVQQTIVPRR